MSIETVEITSPGSFSIVEIRQGPAGTGGGGSVAWDDITGTASDVPFLPVAAPAHSEGLLFYDSTDKSLTYYNDEADVSMNIGRELWVRVRNDSGSPILNGKVVYINDAVGQLPTIRLARADSAVTSRVIGIATHDIGNNEFGYVTTTGEVKGLATNAYDDGDLLFLSAVTAGEMTTTAPLAPNRVIQVATVLHAHPTQGKLYCHPETDSIPSTGIVDSTATGRALITAANASAARTTLELAAAATASTPNTLVLRDANGDASFGQIDTSGLTVTGGTTFGGASLIQFDAVEYYYGAGAASAHRTALGSGATGDALFTAATPAAARTTLELGAFNTNGSITGTGALTFAAGGSNQNINLTPSGTGLVALGQSTVTGSTYPPLDMIRTTAITNALVASSRLTAISSGNISDGFGPTFAFNFSDTGVTNQLAGALGFARAGADNTSDFILQTVNAGTQAEKFRIKANGDATVQGTTASTTTTTGALVVSGGVGVAGAVNSLYQRVGSGTPEGVVTAPVGAVFHRTDGGAGTSFYVKESGTGNTGWVGK